MITKKTWTALVLAGGGGAALALSVLNGFVPGWEDVRDPLGRPSALSLELIDSADRLDTLTSIFVPKHARLAQDMQVLSPVADNLTGLTDTAAALPQHSAAVNSSTAQVSAVAAPLPDLVAAVTGRAEQAGPTVAGLSVAVGSVARQLEAIHQNLSVVQATLGELGPRGATIAATLANIEEEARHVQEFGPLLAVLGPAVNDAFAPPA